MNELKFKRSSTTIAAPLRLKSSDMISKDDNALRYFRAHLKNRSFQTLPITNQDISLTPLVQSIAQPKITNEDFVNKRLVRKANFFYLAKSHSNMSIYDKNQTNSFLVDEVSRSNNYNNNKRIKPEFKPTEELNEKIKYLSNSMILNSQTLFPIDLADNSQNVQLTGRKIDTTKLPYITPNRYEDVFTSNKPSYINNYRQSGTNQNSFKRTYKNFNVHTYAPRVWLRSKYMPNSQWVKQNDVG